MISEAVIEEYRQLKQKYSEDVLLFQVGTFYKILLADAEKWAPELGLKLIKVTKPDGNGKMTEDISFSGFPVSGLDKYVGKLMRRGGANIVICNQVKKDGRVIGREVQEIIRVQKR